MSIAQARESHLVLHPVGSEKSLKIKLRSVRALQRWADRHGYSVLKREGRAYLTTEGLLFAIEVATERTP